MKRKDMGELRPLYPLIGKTMAEARQWLVSVEVANPQCPRVRLVYVRDAGGMVTLDQRAERVNVVCEDGRVTRVVDCG